jgi:hypothetical protein
MLLACGASPPAAGARLQSAQTLARTDARRPPARACVRAWGPARAEGPRASAKMRKALSDSRGYYCDVRRVHPGCNGPGHLRDY